LLISLSLTRLFYSSYSFLKKIIVLLAKFRRTENWKKCPLIGEALHSPKNNGGDFSENLRHCVACGKGDETL